VVAVKAPAAVSAPKARAAAAPAPTRTATARPTATRTTAPKPAPKPSTTQTAQPKGTDDYPYRTQSDFYAVDRWGFTQRQCVSFAAWRLAQHGDTISNDGNAWGSAYSWDDAARRLGHVVTTRARVGAVAQWEKGERSAYYAPGSAKANGTFTAGGYGHVGWVKQVYSDGSALVEQYNMGGDRSYSVMRVKAPRYLVIG
jgi:surface antigen